MTGKDGGFLSSLRNDPATKALLDAGRNYAAARAGSAVSKTANKLSGNSNGGGSLKDKLTGGAMSGAGEATSKGQGRLGKIFGGISGAVKGLFKGKGANKRPTNIVEDLLIGAPVNEVYERYLDWQQHAGYMKAVEAIDANDDDAAETNWKVKVWWSRRSWKATIVDEAPEHRIRWKTDGPKGTVDGVMTFTGLADNLTLILLVIEYRSKGPFEWTANRWRTVGRRARLDLKHFRRHVMMTTEDADEQSEPTENDAVDTDEQPDTEPTAPDSESESTDEDTDEEPDEPEVADEAEEPEPAAKPARVRKPRRPSRPFPVGSGG